MKNSFEYLYKFHNLNIQKICASIIYDIATAYAKEGANHIIMNNVKKQPSGEFEKIDVLIKNAHSSVSRASYIEHTTEVFNLSSPAFKYMIGETLTLEDNFGLHL